MIQNRKPRLLKTFLSLALAQPGITATRFSINSQQGNIKCLSSSVEKNDGEELSALNLLVCEGQENCDEEVQSLEEQEQPKDISQVSNFKS